MAVHASSINTDSRELGVPFVSLVPFADLVICEDAVLDSGDIRTEVLLREACKMNIPVISDRVLSETLTE